MGFVRKIGSTDCKFAYDGAVPLPAKCESGSGSFFMVGHRKVPGDSCEGGWQPTKVEVQCPKSNKISKGGKSVLGTLMIVGLFIAGMYYVSQSDKLKGMFSNYGMDNFGTVKYTTIGANTPETALDSVGTRFDKGDFFDDDRNEFDDAPRLVSRDGDRDRRDRRDERRREPVNRGLDTAAASVPKLQKPPGAADQGGDDEGDSLDLL